jgi:uncharacterized protein with von Willebrand factor type A (vWA) domain
MYPFASLPENVAAFCAMLRRDHQFRIGPRELLDGVRALEIAGVSNEKIVRDALRPVLSKTHDDERVFDDAFDQFFHPATIGLPAREVNRSLGTETAPLPDTRRSQQHDRDETAGEMPAAEEASVTAEAILRPDREDQEEAAEGAWLRASYSPLAAAGEPLVIDPPDRAWLDAAAVLVRRVRAGASRQWRPAARGPRFDFRRTLRSSLHTAGEAVIPKWHAHPKRRPRFVVLIDGSRSMGESAEPAIRTATALSALATNTETFTFSTTLRRVTADVRRAAAGERRMLHLREAWGGGTTIGACLNQFLLEHGARLVDHDTIVLIASDGLDVGRPDLLRDTMASLARRSKGIIWMNPLVRTAGYQPTAIGMSLARRFISRLGAVTDPQSLRSLAHSMKVS